MQKCARVGTRVLGCARVCMCVYVCVPVCTHVHVCARVCTRGHAGARVCVSVCPIWSPMRPSPFQRLHKPPSLLSANAGFMVMILRLIRSTLPYPTLPCPALPCPALPYPTLPYPTLPHVFAPTLLYPTLPYLLALPNPTPAHAHTHTRTHTLHTRPPPTLPTCPRKSQDSPGYVDLCLLIFGLFFASPRHENHAKMQP